MGSDLIFYEFSRSKVERGEFRHFLGQFAFDKLPTGATATCGDNSGPNLERTGPNGGGQPR